MEKRISLRVLSFILVACMLLAFVPYSAIDARAANNVVQVQEGSNTYPLFNSGATSSSGKEYSSSSGKDYNPDSSSYSNSGYDIYGDSSSNYDLTLNMGLSFYVSKAVTEKAILTVYAYDIDEERDQIDDVYLVNSKGSRVRLGNLAGRDETWSTTTLEIDPSYFTVGETYHFEVDVCKGGWWTWIRRVSLQLTTAGNNVVDKYVNPSLSASISDSGLVSTYLTVEANHSATYYLEYSATINSQQKGGYEGVSIAVSANNVASKSVSFQLESGSPSGTYRIDVVIKDALGNTVATTSCNAGRKAFAVSYNSNGGSQNLPVDNTSYSEGNTVVVLFDYIPSKSGYTFLGWAKSSTATNPEFTQNGTKTFTIGSSDVTLYAVWEEDVEEDVEDKPQIDDTWDGTIANGFGGGNGSANNPYLIYTAEQLAYLAKTTNNGTSYSGKYFKLMANLDLNSLEWTPIGKGQLTDDTGFYGTAFSGSFDGQRHTIYNLKITENNTTFNGVFGLAHMATIFNLGIENSAINTSITGDYRVNSGSLVGKAQASTIYNCYAYNTDVYAYSYQSPASAGGLIGNLNGGSNVSNCYSTGTVKSNGHSAVLAGSTYGGANVIKNCYAIGTAKSMDTAAGTIMVAAGIVGDHENGDIINCFFFGDLSSVGELGPIAGNGNGCTNCYHSYNTETKYTGCTYVDSTYFMSESWMIENLQWNFTDIWKYDIASGYSYPVLAGFAYDGNVHSHDYKETVVDPTCESEGYTVYTCSCGDSYTGNYVDKLDHNYIETVITEPSCGVTGTGIAKCQGCGKEKNVFYPALTHNYVNELTREATCTEPGVMTYTCQNCGDTYERYIYVTHNIEEVSRTEASCTVDGKIVYGCTKCDYTYEEKIPGGHDYIAEIITVATQTNEGLVRYTCSKCGDSYDEIIPVRPDANVLLIQDRLPWSENSNSTVLERLKAGGYITGWDMTTTGSFASIDLTQYSVIFIANDQTTATYNQLKTFNDKITQFATAGGVVIYGACDSGWAGGNISYALPGGVTKGNYYSNYNYIVNGTHNVVTGILTDGKALTNQILYNNYCSHTYFNKNTLPNNAVVILSDSKGEATLVEYPMGKGYIIASGLTWEHAFVRDLAYGTSFAKNVYDDLIVHAVSLSNACAHVYSEENIVNPTCEAEGYTAHICEKCGASYKDNIVPKLEHDYVETVITEPSCGVTGTGVAKCTRCQKEIDIFYPALVHNYVSEITKEATCTEAGIMTHTCQICKNTYTTYIYSTHNIELKERIEPTCTVDGKLVYACTKCDYTYDEIIVAEHDYEAEIIEVATPTSEGLVKYTCSKCGDYYYVTTPARPNANILLVQDRLPWTEDINSAILSRLLSEGYITGWDMTTTSNFNSVDLTQYSVIFIANDQTTATYNQLKAFNEKITQFATAGGVVVYGACDNGWAGGNISYALPGGVTKGNYYSNYNYIVNGTHNVVTGVLTDGKALTNQLLYSTYSSHTYFNKSTLPENAIIILSDARGEATLVEYPLGNGYIIASGLTWEYTYVRNFINGTSFAKSVYDDLLVHAVSMGSACEHVYDAGEIVPPSCTEEGYTLHTCENCGATVKSDFVPETGHTPGEWVVVTEATANNEGLKEQYCTVCQQTIATEIIPMLDAGIARVESVLDYVIIDDEIIFVLVIEDADPTKSIGIVPIFDTEIFDIVSAEWLIDAVIQDIEAGTYRSASAWTSATDVNTTVYTFKLKAKALTDGTDVSCTVLLENGNIALTVLPKRVKVIPCHHTDVAFTEIDDTYHARTCNRCGYTEMLEHTYDDVCDASCNDCGFERVPPHAYYDEMSYDDIYHWLVCELCGDIASKTEHSYDNVCDASCNECAYVREAPHAYYADKEFDDVYHWLECELCGDIADKTEHIYDSVCDADCNECAYVREAPHSYTLELVYDDANHWYECTLCGEKKEMSEHSYDGVCDASCNDCGYERTPPHDFAMEWTIDENGHWHTCKLCGEISQVFDHIYDEVCDASCNDCGYERVAPHAYDVNWRLDEEYHWHECTLCGKIADYSQHSYDNAQDRDCNDCGYVRYLLGDVDNDWDVDSDDSIYLLYHLFFGEIDYPVYQPLDYNGDGVENSDDAVHLLYYVIFGANDYPLTHN